MIHKSNYLTTFVVFAFLILGVVSNSIVDSCSDDFSTDVTVLTEKGWDMSLWSPEDAGNCPVENLNSEPQSAMTRVFDSAGTFTVKFGNCYASYTAGTVRIFLNDETIATTQTDEFIEASVQFSFGDVVKIDHSGVAQISIESMQVCENWAGIYFESLGDGKCVDDQGNYPQRYFNGDTIHVAAETCEDLCQISTACIGYSHLPLGDKHTCILYVAAGTDFETVPEGFLAMEMEGTATEITSTDGEVFNDDATFTCNKKEVVQCVLPEQQEGYIVDNDANLQNCFGTLGDCDADDQMVNGVQCEQYWSQPEGLQVEQCTTQDPQVSLIGCVKNQWQTTEWSDCSANCDMGTGYQLRTVTCSAGADEECDPAEKPEVVQTCESFSGTCDFEEVSSNGGTCQYKAWSDGDIGCARQCISIGQYAWLSTKQHCENACRNDPYCRGYSWYNYENFKKCALQTFSDCGVHFNVFHTDNVLSNGDGPALAHGFHYNIYSTPATQCMSISLSNYWHNCQRKRQTFTGNGNTDYWSFAATFQEEFGSAPLEHGPNSALIVTKITPVPDQTIVNWDPVDNIPGKGGVISTLMANEFFDHAGYDISDGAWNGAIFQVLVNGVEEMYVKTYASPGTKKYSMVFQYPIAEENDWSVNDIIMTPIRQCKIPDTLPEGYAYVTEASDAFLVGCSTESDGCMTPEFGGIVCDEENGYVLAEGAIIDVAQCDWPTTDNVLLSGCEQHLCQLPTEQEGFDTSSATLSNCDATPNGCDEPIFEGLECAENYATFPDHLGVEQCTIAEPISTLVGCYEVIHQELDATFWTEADAQLLCQNMADELNGYIYECTLTESNRRRLAEGFAHTLVVRVGVPHLDTAIDQLSKDDFLTEVLPKGMEPHHVDLQEPYQLLMEQPTVAPTQFVFVTQTTLLTEPSSTTFLPILDDESITYVAEHDWFSRESFVTILVAFVMGMCAVMCSMFLCRKTNTTQDKDSPFMNLETKLSSAGSFKRGPSNSTECWDEGLDSRLNTLTKIWSEVAIEHE